jgi:hypothetical protein
MGLAPSKGERTRRDSLLLLRCLGTSEGGQQGKGVFAGWDPDAGEIVQR